jgi:ornithine cyclodeaminase
MLILNSSDIQSSVTILEVLEAVEKAFIFQEEGNYLMPDRMHIEQGKNVLLLMPAFAGEYFSTKLVSVFPDNIKVNRPIIYGTVVLNDSDNGKPLAVLEGSMLTALRTGAVGGLGVAYTSPKEAKSVGLIGAGIQGFHQLLFASTVRNISTIHIYDTFKKDLQEFAGKLSKYLPHAEIIIAKGAEEVVSNSEVIITATTSSTPVMPNDADLLRGKHFVGLGSFKPDMQEFPENLYKLTEKIIIDTDLAKIESGDIRVPLEKELIKEDEIFRLGQLINKEIEINDTETTFFKSVGMALFDLLTAEMIYKKAKEKGIGIEVDF